MHFNGLTDKQVEESRKKYGSNVIPDSEPTTFWAEFKETFKDPMIRILLAIAALMIVMCVLGYAEIYEPIGTVVAVLIVAFVSAKTGVASDTKYRQLKDSTKKDQCKVYRNGLVTVIDVDDVVVGDKVLLQSGDKVPADGVLIHGTLRVDNSALNGEAEECPKTAADESFPLPEDITGDTFVDAHSLFRGAVLFDGEGVLDVRKVGLATMMGKMAEEMQDDEPDSPLKVKLGKLADMISRFGYIGAVVIAIMYFGYFILSAGGFAAYFSSGAPVIIQDIVEAVSLAVVIIVCAVPEGLPLMISLVLMQNTSKMLDHNVLVRKAEGIETAGSLNILFSDKTGTITSGQPEVTDLIPAAGVTEQELLQAAVSLEVKSEHPLAAAIMKRGEEAQIQPEAAEDFAAITGSGLKATVLGAQLLGGSVRYMASQLALPQEMEKQADALSQAGKTPLLFAKNGRLLGLIAVADAIKPESPEAIRQLRGMGIRVVMLTGDNERTAKAIGAQAGVDEVIAGVLPDGKEAVIRRLKEQGKVAMVGDGINDAPALTRADTGIAIGAGTDVAIDAADVVLMKSRLLDVPAAIRLSRATLRNIHENLFWAFFYNVIGIPLAAGAWIHLLGWEMNPMFGAAAMSLSSFCVVTNALRLNLFRIRSTKHDHKRKNHAKQTVAKTAEDHKENKEETSMEKTMKIEGMMCGHCEARVKKCLEALPGVEKAEVSHVSGTAVLTLSAPVEDALLKKTVEDQGYQVI